MSPPCRSAEACDERFGEARNARQIRDEVVDLLRPEAALHLPMDVDGACLSGHPEGEWKSKDKGKNKTHHPEGTSQEKNKRVKSRVCSMCHKPGHLRQDWSVFQKRMAEKGADEKFDAGGVQGAMVQAREHADNGCVFAFEDEEGMTRLCRDRRHTYAFDSGSSRLACPSDHAAEATARGMAPPLFSIDGAPIEQRGYKSVQQDQRDSAGETNRIRATVVEAGVLFPAASAASPEENGTPVAFSCSRRCAAHQC